MYEMQSNKALGLKCGTASILVFRLKDGTITPLLLSFKFGSRPNSLKIIDRSQASRHASSSVALSRSEQLLRQRPLVIKHTRAWPALQSSS